MAATVSNPIPGDVPGRLRIVVSQEQAMVTIALTGEWDLGARMPVGEAIQGVMSLRPERVVLDLSRLSFIDSSGIHAAVGLHERAIRQNTQLEITPARERCNGRLRSAG
jgi:anti-anti-sigma factor